MENIDQILSHFTSENPLDGGNDKHVRIVMACLVNAVYIISETEEATLWYESFHFSRHENILDPTTHHILGVIFKFNELKAQPHHRSLEKAPLYVVALRGITSPRDIKDCWNMASGMLYHSKRVIKTVQFVQRLMSVENHLNKDRIWWAGHSLGSAVTTCSIIRMNQNDEEYKPQTFLFDPPFGSHILGNLIDSSPLLPIPQCFPTSSFLHTLSFLPTISLFLPVGNVRSVLNLYPRPKLLHEWTPNLFVNPNDLLCSGFIGHFENRKKILKFNHHWDYVKLLHSARLVKNHQTNDNHLDLVRSVRLVKHHHTDDNLWNYLKFLLTPRFLKAHRILKWCQYRCQMEYKTYKNGNR